MRWRNARAVAEVDAARAAGCTKVALVYGALHMRDLRSRLLQRYSLVSVDEPIWRTAWSVGVPAEDKGAPGRSVLVLAALSLVLLAVDAFDWIDCTEAVLRTVAVQLTPTIGALALAGHMLSMQVLTTAPCSLFHRCSRAGALRRRRRRPWRCGRRCRDHRGHRHARSCLARGAALPGPACAALPGVAALGL